MQTYSSHRLDLWTCVVLEFLFVELCACCCHVFIHFKNNFLINLQIFGIFLQLFMTLVLCSVRFVPSLCHHGCTIDLHCGLNHLRVTSTLCLLQKRRSWGSTYKRVSIPLLLCQGPLLRGQLGWGVRPCIDYKGLKNTNVQKTHPLFCYTPPLIWLRGLRSSPN